MKRKVRAQIRKARKGFALVIVLSLMILLTILAVGLLTLSSVNLRAASQGEAMSVARANARLAIMMAIGQIQRYAGGDKAVTANSEVIVERPSKPHLTGVWQSWDFSPNAASLNYDTEKKSRFRRWLVSSADPDQTTEPKFSTTGWNTPTVDLVGEGTLGKSMDDTQQVKAGLVPISTNGKTGGATAWYVSDESSKIRINNNRKPAAGNDTLARRRAATGGQRPYIWDMTSLGGANLDFLPHDIGAGDATSDKKFEEAEEIGVRFVDLDEVDLAPGSPSEKVAGQFWHDVTPYSMGLLTNARTGGFKQDLSCIFETNGALPAEFDGKRLYQSTHGITGPSDPNWSALSSYYNVFRSLRSADGSPTINMSPSERVQTPTSNANFPMPTKFYPGPVIAKIDTLFTYVTRDAHAGWLDGLKAINPEMKYMAHLMYTPLVTLYNPYNVSITFDKLQVIIRNPPVAFQFIISGQPQSTDVVTLGDMFYNGRNGEKSFALDIANWTSPTGTSTSGSIVMKPGQTLVCGPYLNPAASFSNTQGTPFFDYENNLTGVTNGTIIPVKGKPGFNGPCIGYDADWLNPPGVYTSNDIQTDKGMGIIGVRTNDTISIKFRLAKPKFGYNGSDVEFQVSAKLTAGGRQAEYGGMVFRYENDTVLARQMNAAAATGGNYSFPESGTVTRADTYVPNTTSLANHGAQPKTFAVFSAYARTANGGVFETNKRLKTPGALNSLRDGRLAGKPFLFHNLARNATWVNLKDEKAGPQSHELNFQPLSGRADDLYEIDATNRTRALTANTITKGIKSGSLFELPSGPMLAIADFRRSNALSSSYLPATSQPVANSQACPLISTSKSVQTADRSIAPYALLDHSMLANHALYDRFYFSSVGIDGTRKPNAVFKAYMTNGERLPNQNLVAYQPAGTTPEGAESDLFNSGSGLPTATAYQKMALYQMMRGPFNVNSTSVQAWKAMLSSLTNNQIQVLWEKTAQLQGINATAKPVLAMTLHNAGSANGQWNPTGVDDSRSNEFSGFRELDDKQVTELAKRIVEQVRTRGPFLSLSEFVNRRLGPESESTLAGALETAISKAGINDRSFTDMVPVDAASVSDGTVYGFKTVTSSIGNPAAGAPGWVSQGDLMRIIEPSATVRGDTFVIRACGEARDASGKVTARAYAQAVVQRLPNYLDSVDEPSINVYTDSSAAQENRQFGRRMEIISFCWLQPSSI